MSSNQQAKHAFERSGLGKAPFRVISEGEALKHSNIGHIFFCEHCGTMIKHRYFVLSADDVVSVVGIDCVNKTGDAGIIAGARHIKRHKRFSDAENERNAITKAKEAEEIKQYGKTIRELKVEASQARDALFASLSEQAENLIFNNKLLRYLSCQSQRTDDFNQAVLTMVAQLSPLSRGMVRILCDIETKRLSEGARKGSKKFLASREEAVANVEAIVNFIDVANKRLESINWESFLAIQGDSF